MTYAQMACKGGHLLVIRHLVSHCLQIGNIINAVSSGSIVAPVLPDNITVVVGAILARDITQAWAYTVIQLYQVKEWTGSPSVVLDMQNTTLWASLVGWQQAAPLVQRAPYVAIRKPLPFNHQGDPEILQDFRQYWRGRAAGGAQDDGDSGGIDVSRLVGGLAGGIAGIGILGAHSAAVCASALCSSACRHTTHCCVALCCACAHCEHVPVHDVHVTLANPRARRLDTPDWLFNLSRNSVLRAAVIIIEGVLIRRKRQRRKLEEEQDAMSELHNGRSSLAARTGSHGRSSVHASSVRSTRYANGSRGSARGSGRDPGSGRTPRTLVAAHSRGREHCDDDDHVRNLVTAGVTHGVVIVIHKLGWRQVTML